MGAFKVNKLPERGGCLSCMKLVVIKKLGERVLGVRSIWKFNDERTAFIGLAFY